MNICRECPGRATVRGLCGRCYQRNLRNGTLQTRKWSSRAGIPKRIQKLWANIQTRCTNPNVRSYRFYGGRGVQNRLSMEDLIFLWDRDHADLLSQPSIDRIDSAGHYVIENCRFIEMAVNRGLSKMPLGLCWVCNQRLRRERSFRCEECRGKRFCKVCHAETVGHRWYCANHRR